MSVRGRLRAEVVTEPESGEVAGLAAVGDSRTGLATRNDPVDWRAPEAVSPHLPQRGGVAASPVRWWLEHLTAVPGPPWAQGKGGRSPYVEWWFAVRGRRASRSSSESSRRATYYRVRPPNCRIPVSPSRWSGQAPTRNHRDPWGVNHRTVYLGNSAECVRLELLRTHHAPASVDLAHESRAEIAKAGRGSATVTGRR
jgi:hypothetical protein